MIVFILRELTRQFDDLWIKITDSDGEFLLVEAAAMLPAWLEPDVADNRVWINKGRLLIIKPEGQKGVVEKLSFGDAKRVIQNEPKRIMHSSPIESEAFYRLRNYPRQISDNMHTAHITVPRKVAHLLHLKPAYISPVVEAFYLRDPISLRPLKGKGKNNLLFPPDDLITISVRFSRVGYAQLRSQDFDAPAVWKDKFRIDDSKDRARLELGMKVTCGFEMMLSDPQNRDKAAVREIKLVLDDLDSGDETLPTDEQVAEWDQREDDEGWLDVSLDDLDDELRGRSGDKQANPPKSFGDEPQQENLRRIVAQFQNFLNDDSAGFDGADLINEFDSDEDEPDTSSGEEDEPFDNNDFSKMMQDMMGPKSGPRMHTGNSRRVEEVDSDEDDSKEIEELSKQFEAELRGTGVLDLRDSGKKQKSVKGKEPAGDENDIDEEDPDVNLAANLLESFQSQAGAAGPSSNLTGLMGLKFPKCDRE